MIASKNGFTLVEMSIVIVIIAIIISAVSIGSSLTKNANLRTIISEYNYYQEAIFAFNHQYGYLPGDIPIASNIWSNCDSTGSNNSNYCNGNGDGYIEITNSTGGTGPFGNSASILAEGKMAWRHLTLAKMIKGNYDGVISSSWSVNSLNTYPQSSYTGLIWTFDNSNQYSASIYTPANGGVGNSLSLIGYNNNGGSQNYAPALTPTDSYNLDNKIDDGLPSNGFVAASYVYQQSNHATTSCTASDATLPVVANNSYKLTNNNSACSIYFYFNGKN